MKWALDGTMAPDQRLNLMVNVAQLYYREKMTQTQIAKQFDISHATVSRILAEALEQGVVEIVIHYPWLRDSELEKELKSVFDLKLVRVLDSRGLDYENLIEGLGILAAEVLDQRLHDEISIGVSRGRGVNATAKHLTPHPDWKIDVVQLQGALEDQKVAKYDLASTFFEKYTARFHVLHAPMILDDQETRQMLIRKPLIKNVLEKAKTVELALVGVGTLDLEYSNHMISGEFTQNKIRSLQKEGLVGDICGLHFNADGQVPDDSVNRRIISIGEKSLKQIPFVIGVGGGMAKALPILASLRGNFLDGLVTDKVAANQLLDWKKNKA